MRSFPSVLALALALAVAALTASGCHRQAVGRAKVAVSIFPLYDLTRRIAGPDADVVLVVKPPALAQSFTPTATDEGAVAGAKVGVMVGLGLDLFLETLVKGGDAKARILKVGDRVPTLSSPNGVTDPTFWLDPQRARIAVKAIGEELARNDVTHAIVFRARAAELDAALEKLDAELDAKARGWKQHRLSVDGEGVAYFADRYAVELVSADAVPAAPKLSVGSLDLVGGTQSLTSYELVVRTAAQRLDELLAR